MIMIKFPNIFSEINAALETLEDNAEQREELSEKLSAHKLKNILEDNKNADER